MDLDKIPELNVSLKRAVSNGQVYEVLTEEEYFSDASKYVGRNDIGILLKHNGDDVVIPLRNEDNASPVSPGVYHGPNSPIAFTKMPEETVMHKYIPDKIVSINNLSNVQDIIKTSEEIRKLDEPFITTPDEITKIPIRPEDQPEMVCLKSAINAKNIDIDKYANRFSSNYPNDKRQLRNTSVTLNIIKRFCANMDMEAILTLKDKAPDVPNPIGKEISVSLTDEFIDEEE
jgi:hypothetical protein